MDTPENLFTMGILFVARRLSENRRTYCGNAGFGHVSP
jgi:hypothetical protein